MFIKFNGAQLLPLRWKTVVSTKSQPDDVHVIRDWDNAPLPIGYDIETLFTKIEEGLKKHNPSMTIKSVVACGEHYALAINEEEGKKKKIADDRTRFFKQDTRCRIIKVPSRKRTCDGCGHTFPNVSDLTEQQRADRFKGQDEYSRVTDVGDAILAREMIILNFNHPPPCYVLLISADKDFESSMNFMTRRGYKVLLSSPVLNPLIRDFSSGFWKWTKLIQGENPEDPLPDRQFDFVGERQNIQLGLETSATNQAHLTTSSCHNSKWSHYVATTVNDYPLLKNKFDVLSYSDSSEED